MTSETIHLYVRRDVSGADLSVLASSHPGRWFYGERPQDTVLMWAADVQQASVPWQVWRHGRRFGLDGEISWWRDAKGTFTCRLLAMVDAGWDEGVEYAAVEGVPSETLLHGQYDENSEPPTWSEARIPRLFNYPVEVDAPDMDTRAVLMTRTYRGHDGHLIDRLLAVETRVVVEGG